jgi:biotin operon repressor
MKKTTHYKGHRWTTDELRQLMLAWAAGDGLYAIADSLNVTLSAVLKMIQKLRKNGIPMQRRHGGHVAGRSYRSWTQGEVEYLIRRREEKATCEEIGVELGRTPNAVHGMIQKLRQEQVPVAMRGNGVRRLWNADELKAVAVQSPDDHIIELDMPQRMNELLNARV